MKKNIIFSILAIICCMSQILHAQELTNREKLDQYSAEMLVKQKLDLNEAIIAAKRLGMPLYGIYKLDERGIPMYMKSMNNTAAATTGTTDLRVDQNVDGAGMTIGVWECCNTGAILGNIPLLTHQDFGSRVTIRDNTPASSHSRHATHVTGTLIGAPPSSASSQSRGMAFKANADAYGISGDAGEMAAAGASTIAEVAMGKLLVSNHSYGSVVGWAADPAPSTSFTWFGGSSPYNQNGASSLFGQYSGSWDAIAINAEYYLICKSAGNDRNDIPGSGTQVRNAGGTYTTYNPSIHPGQDGGASGFDCIAGTSSDKNILTVGAVDNSMNMSTFSGFGPTDDGRVKPDICGVGVALNSATNASNTSYGNSNGTSMSSPQVAGSLLLLQELYNDKLGFGTDRAYMKATSLKALAINSATDRGNIGPDYAFGFGVLNAKKAGESIVDDAKIDYTGKTVIIEDVIETSDEVFEFPVNVSTNADFRVTLVYHDVRADTLVNDLDMIIRVKSKNTLDRPWRLDPANPNNLAVLADNDIDNVEHYNRSDLAGDLFHIQVFVEDTLYQNEPQKFSLVISGIDTGCQPAIQHKTKNLPSSTYTAQELILSEATIRPGVTVNYQTNGKTILKPGFHAMAQNSTGTGSFRTSSGTCN